MCVCVCWSGPPPAPLFSLCPCDEGTSRGDNFPSVLGGCLAVAWQRLILLLVLVLLQLLVLVLALLLWDLLPVWMGGWGHRTLPSNWPAGLPEFPVSFSKVFFSDFRFFFTHFLSFLHSLSVRVTRPLTLRRGPLPLAAAHQLLVELLVALGGFDGVGQLPGFDEVIVVVVSLQVVGGRGIAGSRWAGLPVWTLLLLLGGLS